MWRATGGNDSSRPWANLVSDIVNGFTLRRPGWVPCPRRAVGMAPKTTSAGRGWERGTVGQRSARQRISQATTARVPRRAHRSSQPSFCGRAPLGVGPWSAGGGSVFGAPRGARRDMNHLHDSAIKADRPDRPGKRCQVRTTLTGDQRGPPLSTPGPRPRPGGVRRRSDVVGRRDGRPDSRCVHSDAEPRQTAYRRPTAPL
jgi:hypothetical protein